MACLLRRVGLDNKLTATFSPVSPASLALDPLLLPHPGGREPDDNFCSSLFGEIVRLISLLLLDTIEDTGSSLGVMHFISLVQQQTLNSLRKVFVNMPRNRVNFSDWPVVSQFKPQATSYAYNMCSFASVPWAYCLMKKTCVK